MKVSNLLLFFMNVYGQSGTPVPTIFIPRCIPLCRGDFCNILRSQDRSL